MISFSTNRGGNICSRYLHTVLLRLRSSDSVNFLHLTCFWTTTVAAAASSKSA